MKRRDFITLVGGAAAWPLAARAQQPAMPVIGFLGTGSAAPIRDRVAAFLRGLNEAGFAEGRNVSIEYRWADNQYDRLPDLAADLVRRRVTVLVAPGGTAGALAAKALTTTIPILFSTSVDPVQIGLVASLSRPGGNISGIVDMAVDIATKQFGLLSELLPGATRFALLVDPRGPAAEPTIAQVKSAASSTGRQIEILTASTNFEIDSVFVSLAQKRAHALLVANQVLFFTRRVQLQTLATRHAIPTIYSGRVFVEAGGLMSYGSDANDRERQLGIYTGRVLKGEKPADLPVVRASKFEFVINLQTAKALGLEVPPTLLARADEVIE
jgi:putative tryptophan/tyrosine transport system substrate-binding protein